MTMPSRKTLWLAGGGALLLALLIPRFFGSNPGAPGAGGDRGRGGPGQAIRVSVEVVRPVEIGGTVSAVGTVLSNEEIQVRSQVSGQIEKIAFGEGARVSRGDVLVKINDDELQAQLLRAKSRMAIAEQQAERQKQLFEKQFISQEEFNNALNELNVVRAEAQLTEAQISKTEITAPFDGTIGLRFVSEGSYVSPAAVITTLQDNARMKIDFTIPEKYARLIGEGDSIRFRVQTRQESYSARIYSTDSRIDPTTRTLRVRAATPNPKGALLAGAFASVEVALNPRKALTIPAYALIPELRGHKVFVLRSGKAEPRPVVIGDRSDDRVEITSGLAAGDTLITSGILQLRPGMEVVPGAEGGRGAK
jgi:membrane fusion protein (multidrug efflux system)